MRILKQITALMFLGYFHCSLLGQKNDSLLNYFREKELYLNKVADFAFRSKNEKQRIDSNKVFFNILKELVTVPELFYYSFDSLKKDVSILQNKDNTFRIITWNLPKNEGTHIYFGFIQMWYKKNKSSVPEYRMYVLNDVSDNIKNNPETYVGNPQKWFGMLYYQMIDCKDYWLLLGWDGNEKLVQRKFIDVLYFKADGTPVFGKDVFKIPKKNPKRIMFQYSTDVTMTLRYEPKKNGIVFNHLSPESDDPYLKEQYQFYGPDGSFDAFVKSRNKWELIEDVDVRNDYGTYTKKPDVKKQKPLYQPK